MLDAFEFPLNVEDLGFVGVWGVFLSAAKQTNLFYHVLFQEILQKL